MAWKSQILSKEQQIPEEGSIGSELLSQLMAIDPNSFEKIICKLIEHFPGLVHKIHNTRYVKDGGFDFEGSFLLPSPFKYPIKFKGEIKRHKLGIRPKDVSRLVARLSRGEYGLFFTTSYFTKDAQEEVIKDNYPCKLITGLDLFNFFYEAKLIDENGIINKDWLETIFS